ncbi:MAG TPA: hypothetical protein VGN52_22210 [Burkholderiales bacterium]
MNKLRIFLTVACLAGAGAAHALDITYENDPGLRMPVKPVSEQQRQIDLALGNCLKANGGRMTGRCAALRDKSDQAEMAAKANADMSGNAQAAAPVTGAPVVVPGPTATEGPVSTMPDPAK